MVGHVRSETLSRNEGGALGKYMSRVAGSDNLLRLAWYEFITTFLSGFPGALGVLLRKTVYPTILGRCGKGVAFSRGVTLRCPARLFVGEGKVGS